MVAERGAREKAEKKPGTQPRSITARFTEPTRAALVAYATDKGLPVSHAVEQLVIQALAAQTTAAVESGAAPALDAQIQSSVRAALAGTAADIVARCDRLSVEVGATRLMAYALIAYAYGEGEARRAEEATVRVALKAVATGDMAALPPGIVRHGSA